MVSRLIWLLLDKPFILKNVLTAASEHLCTHVFQQQGLVCVHEVDYTHSDLWPWWGFEWRFRYRYYPWSRWRIVCHAWLTSLVCSPVNRTASTTLLCSFLFVSIGWPWWCTESIDRFYLFISLSSLLLFQVLPTVQDMSLVFLQLFRLCVHFIGESEQGVGQNTTQYPEWTYHLQWE